MSKAKPTAKAWRAAIDKAAKDAAPRLAEAAESIDQFGVVLDRLNIARPTTLDDWHRLAITFDMPVDLLRSGEFTLADVADHCIAWTHRELAKQSLASPAIHIHATREAPPAAPPQAKRETKQARAYDYYCRAIEAEGFEKYSCGDIWDALNRSGERLEWTRAAFVRAVNRQSTIEHGPRRERKTKARSTVRADQIEPRKRRG